MGSCLSSIYFCHLVRLSNGMTIQCVELVFAEYVANKQIIQHWKKSARQFDQHKIYLFWKYTAIFASRKNHHKAQTVRMDIAIILRAKRHLAVTKHQLWAVQCRLHTWTLLVDLVHKTFSKQQLPDFLQILVREKNFCRSRII